MPHSANVYLYHSKSLYSATSLLHHRLAHVQKGVPIDIALALITGVTAIKARKPTMVIKKQATGMMQQKSLGWFLYTCFYQRRG